MITTDRLILRAWQESDADALYRFAKDPAVGPIAGWNPHQSVEESCEIIRTVFAAPETYAVCLRESGEPIGCVGLQTGDAANLPLAFREAELGYWLGVPHWGKGYIPEACQALIAYAFTELHYDALWCCCNDINAQSKRVMEKCHFTHIRTEERPAFTQDADGWTFTGRTRMEYIARLTRWEWEKLA